MGGKWWFENNCWRKQDPNAIDSILKNNQMILFYTEDLVSYQMGMQLLHRYRQFQIQCTAVAQTFHIHTQNVNKKLWTWVIHLSKLVICIKLQDQFRQHHIGEITQDNYLPDSHVRSWLLIAILFLLSKFSYRLRVEFSTM